MRSRVERRMRKESGKTLREVRRAKKLKKKLMTDEERLVYNLKRAKKKVALLLQKLKKYELPELPTPVHDPELLTPEQLQAYKKIGFRNKNYVPVGVRGVFGGVVQNMHLHWKFHETVQVCCDNFPKEKIKEMATMLTRLSGGIVVNIHNVKTIIMFRGRNYRQPKNLIPINTLTKRKALFKARFEQALESQKLNIKKIEQQLRRMGVNPEDPVAMASIRRVASTFFNAIDKREGSPYIFPGDKQSGPEPYSNIGQAEEPPADSDQEELDKFISEIEHAADQEWAAEEAAEKEEFGRLRYWNREEFGGRYRKFERYDDSNDNDVKGARGWKNPQGKRRPIDGEDEEGDSKWDSDNVGDACDFDSGADGSDEALGEFERSRADRRKLNNTFESSSAGGSNRNFGTNFRRKMVEKDSESESMFSDLENAMWESDPEEKHDSRYPRTDKICNYRSSSSSSSSSSSEENDIYAAKSNKSMANHHENDADDSDEAYDEKDSDSEVMYGESEAAMWESDSQEGSRTSRPGQHNYQSDNNDEHYDHIRLHKEMNHGRTKTVKQKDENWDSD